MNMQHHWLLSELASQPSWELVVKKGRPTPRVFRAVSPWGDTGGVADDKPSVGWHRLDGGRVDVPHLNLNEENTASEAS